jgi:acetate kinase
MNAVLVLNAGSSSIKYRLFSMDSGNALAGGLLEGIGEPASQLTHRSGTDEAVRTGAVADLAQGFAWIQQAFGPNGLPGDLTGIGHRVVHGGSRFSAPALIDPDVIAAIEEQVPLAPLHNPGNLEGIRTAAEIYPDVPQVAVFDTAFHSTMPARAYQYALPLGLSRGLGLRRYGFHGTSHRHVSRRAAEQLGLPLEDLNLITLHLGNGASVAAIAGGRCIDTSMGLTPMEGLVMGTRSGDIDPGILLHLQRVNGLSAADVDMLLNKNSGLKGLTGSNDVREIQRRADTGDTVAVEALDLYCYRIRKYVGAYTAALGRVDALVFTAGVGENSPQIRAGVCAGLECLGVRLDSARNDGPSGSARIVSAADSAVAVLVVPTNEELEIAEQTLSVIREAAAGPLGQTSLR